MLERLFVNAYRCFFYREEALLIGKKENFTDEQANLTDEVSIHQGNEAINLLYRIKANLRLFLLSPCLLRYFDNEKTC